MEAEVSLSKKCITCLGETSLMHSLSEMFDDYLDFRGILKVCLHCEVDQPFLPKMLCDDCLVLLKEFFKFKMRFINNEVAMRNNFQKLKNDFPGCVEDEIELLKDSFEENIELEKEIKFEVVAEELEEDIHSFIPEDFSEEKNDKLQRTKKNKNVVDDDGFLDEDANISEEPTKYKCSICKIFFIDVESLDVHLFKHKNHKCEICQQIFAKKSYLSDHMITHKNTRDIPCPMCHKTFKSRHTMRAHMRIHTNPGGFVCESCGRSFTHRGSLKTHIKLKHSSNRDYLCIWCGIKFNLKTSLDKHTLRKHSSQGSRKMYKCRDCDAKYLNKSSLDRHHKIKHSPNYQLVPCELCHKVFSDKSNLFRHKRTKHSEELVEFKEQYLLNPKVRVERYILNE
ncbi:hypothetical protein HHI36_009378 [Cryptolaemus montrouzieri]|uniref:Uncharacterized protein n=1 Tax=Cryptolaemus montrouzieri TaxID=559131 RepID=A0ABD2MV27_9CUCU